MRFFSLIFFIHCFFSYGFAELPIIPYLTSENDTLSLIEGIVDVYNGKLVQMDKDLEIHGPHPLELLRYYDGGHHFDSELGYGVGFSFPLLLQFDPEQDKKNLSVEQRAGFEVVCTVNERKSSRKDKKKNKRYRGGVDAEFFKNGYTNCCESLLRGEASLLALQVEGDRDQFTVTLGDGTKRYYSYFRYDFPTNFYRLTREDCPNGNHRHFNYIDNKTLLLKRVWTTNSTNTLTLNWVKFSYTKTFVQVDASNGQSVCYHQKIKKGTAKNNTMLSYSSVKFSKNVLEKVTAKHLPTCEYEPISRSHYTCSLFSTKQVNRPDGRFIKVDYDDYERIKNLWTAELDTPLYKFDYHSNHTTVTDANGASQRFFYHNRRLIKHEEPYRTQHFEWDDKGQLAKQVLTDSHSQPIIERNYDYNPRGQVTEAKVTGSIRESGSKDTYVIRYHYSGDGCNLVCEEHPEGLIISYGYHPNSNLLASKLTAYNGLVVEREFYQYDSNGIRISINIDDSHGIVQEDFSYITYRKITEITPQLDENLPGMTLPKIIQEGYQDLHTGIRHNLKRIERTYCDGDLLAEEKIFDAQGTYCYSLLYKYNDRRELISETDALGYQTIYQYDNNGNKIYEEKIGSGRRVIYAYDNANHLIRESESLDDGNSFTTTYDYDSLGNRKEITDLFNQKSRFGYDLASRETSATDPLGYVVRKEYDAQGNITHQTDQNGHLTKTVYNLYGKPLEIHYPDGTEKRFAYNLQGYLIYEKERDGLTTFYEVDYKGRVTVAKTFANETLLKTIKKSYKGSNLILEVDAMGNQISYAYDSAGRLISKAQGEKLTRFEYDSLGRMSKTINSEQIEAKEYDFLDRVVEERIEDHLGAVFRKTCYVYDIFGNCHSQKNYSDAELFDETKTHYNSKNQPILMIDACGNQTSISYHYSDHLKKETSDALGRKKLEIYDPLQRLKEVFHYSPRGILLAHHGLGYDGRSNQTTYKEDVLCEGQCLDAYTIETTYDCMGQKLSETEQNKKSTRYTYQNGRLNEIINPNGVILSHSYDALGHLTRLTSSDGTIDYKYTYDDNDNLQTAEDLISQTITKRAYDIFNRQVFEKQATGFEMTFAYDTIDRLKEVSFLGSKICYDYCPTSLISAKRYQENNLIYHYNQTSDWRGKIINCQLPNHSKISYTWNPLGKCLTIDSEFYHQNQSYNAVGNLIDLSVKDPLGTHTTNYSYDDLDQLTSETGPFSNLYLCDSINNRRKKNGAVNTVNDLNQVTQDSNNHFTYDPNGRRLTKDDAAYTYDALGRLTKFTNGKQSIHYTYDPFGRLIERNAAGSKVQFLYQFDAEIASFENGQITAFRPIHGIHAPFAVELKGIVYSLIRNHRGDLCLLLDDHKPVCTYRYNAFGEFSHQGDIHSPWLFSGQRHDCDTCLYHYAKREYDPTLGVWLTPDPSGFTDGPNLYSYVNNNPLIYIDPYGLWRTDPSRLISEDREIRAKEFREGARRGFIDDTSFGASEYVLGEYKYTSLSSRVGYYAGTGGSLAAGCIYGGTWLKGGMAACRIMKTALNFSKGAKALKETKKVSLLAKETNLAVQNARQAILKTDITKQSVRKRLVPDTNATGTHTVWRKNPVTEKVNHYQTFQQQTNSKNPNPWENLTRFDNSGKKDAYHYNKVLDKRIYEPHVHDPNCPGGIRSAYAWETPN